MWLTTIVAWAAAPVVPSEEELGPVTRVWAGGGDCDAGPLMRSAGASVVMEVEQDLATTVLVNQDALSAWRAARRCGRLGRQGPSAVFDLYMLARVASAEAELIAAHDPVAGAGATVGVLELGLDVSSLGVIGAAVSNTVWLDGLGLLEDHWVELDQQERRRIVRRVRRLWEARPDLDLDAERAIERQTAIAYAEHTWFPVGICLLENELAIAEVEAALAASDPLARLGQATTFHPVRALAFGCRSGIQSVAADWYEDQQRIEARLLALEATPTRR